MPPPFMISIKFLKFIYKSFVLTQYEYVHFQTNTLSSIFIDIFFSLLLS